MKEVVADLTLENSLIKNSIELYRLFRPEHGKAWMPITLGMRPTPLERRGADPPLTSWPTVQERAADKAPPPFTQHRLEEPC